MNQEEFAAAMGYKSRDIISRVERGEQEPTDRFVQQLDMLDREVSLKMQNPPQYAESEFAESLRVKEPEYHFAGPREAVRAAREARGWTRKDLAERAHVMVKVIQGIEEGTSGTSERVIRRICDAMPELDSEQLMSGSDTPIIEDESRVTGTFGAEPKVQLIGDVPKPKYIPVVGWAQAGALGHYTDEAFAREGVLGFGVTDPDAVAIPIRGDSMTPQYVEGDVAIVLPNSEARDGDLVIACLHDHKGGDVMFKLYHQLEGERVEMQSYSMYYPSRVYDLKDFRFIYPVDSVIKKTRRR